MRHRPPRVPSGLPSINGESRAIFDGPGRAGTVAKVGQHWKALGYGGLTVGLYETEVEAARAVVSHHRSVRSAH